MYNRILSRERKRNLYYVYNGCYDIEEFAPIPSKRALRNRLLSCYRAGRYNYAASFKFKFCFRMAILENRARLRATRGSERDM